MATAGNSIVTHGNRQPTAGLLRRLIATGTAPAPPGRRESPGEGGGGCRHGPGPVRGGMCRRPGAGHHRGRLCGRRSAGAREQPRSETPLAALGRGLRRERAGAGARAGPQRSRGCVRPPLRSPARNAAPHPACPFPARSPLPSYALGRRGGRRSLRAAPRPGTAAKGTGTAGARSGAGAAAAAATGASAPPTWRPGTNSPANRQSFSALHFWITTSISF